MATPSYLEKYPITINDMSLENVETSDSGGLIYQTFVSLGLIATEQVAKVNEILATAEALLAEFGMPDNWTDGIEAIDIPAVPPIDPSTMPDLPLPGDLPGYGDIVWGTNDTSITTYSSDVYSTLLAKILSDITTGGTGIPTAIEDAIHERNLEKQRVANENLYAQGVEEISSQCLSFPQYAIDARALQVAIEIAKQSHNSANEIDIAMAELAQKNMNTALDRAEKLENVLRDFWKDYNNMKFAAVKAATDELIAHVDAISKEREGILKLYETGASVYKTTGEGQKYWYEAIAASQQALLAKATLELRKLEVELKAKLDAYVSVNSLREKILATGGTFSTQLAASALNAENVSVGANFSNQNSNSETYHHSETKQISQSQGLSEDHNINHKGGDIA